MIQVDSQRRDLGQDKVGEAVFSLSFLLVGRNDS